jgi:hypothetical protein
VTLITFAHCEKEGRVGVTGLEKVGVSTDGVTGLDVAGESTVLDDSLGDRSGLFEDELDFSPVEVLDLEIVEGSIDTLVMMNSLRLIS